MASPQGSYGGYLEKIKAAQFDKTKRNYSQKVKQYNAAITRLGPILNGKTIWTDERRKKALKELKTLQEYLSQEDGQDFSIKDAKSAIKGIESKLEKNQTGERGITPGALNGGDISVQGRSTASTHSPKQSAGSGSNITAEGTNGQAGVSKKSTPKQAATSGQFDDENFVTFLKELTSIIADEQLHFSDEVLNWCKHRRNTDTMQALIEKIVNQRSRRVKLDSELKDCQDRLTNLTAKENSGDSSRAPEASKSTDKKAAESCKPASEEKENLKIETLHKELDEITSQISALRHEIQKEEKSAKKTSVDRKWQDDIKEIRQMVRDRDERLKGMQNSIQLADVLDELRVIEERLILTYKTEDMNMQIRNKRKITKPRPPSNAKEIMRESLTVLVDRVDNMMNYFAQRTKMLREENSELAQHNSNMKADTLAIKNNMEKLGNEKADLVLRLSNIAGARLTENNHSIADLSDPYRPTKLSERYLEIFDNEWTEAYEAMDKGGDMKEQKICLELLNILLKAESECREMAKTQYEQLRSRCTSPVGPGENGQLDSIHLSLINDLQKQTAKISISSVQKKILKDNKVSMKSELVNYQKKCVEICWHMSLQTPPMVLDKSLKEGQAFDSERYNWYTRKGKYVEFIVWPPLLLHKDGPLLGKGVAQVK